MSSTTDTRGTRRWIRRTLATVLAVVSTTIVTGSADARRTNPRHETGAVSSLASIADTSSGQSGAMLGGFTSQGWPGFFQFSRNGRTLVIGAIGVDMSCQPSGVQFSIEGDYSRVPIATNGRLHASIAVPATTLSDGTTMGMFGSMTGWVNRGRTRLTGTWQLQLTYARQGQAVDHCSSGPVRFTGVR